MERRVELIVSRGAGITMRLPDGKIANVRVLEIRGSQVMLGIEADRSIPVLKAELGPWKPQHERE